MYLDVEIEKDEEKHSETHTNCVNNYFMCVSVFNQLFSRSMRPPFAHAPRRLSRHLDSPRSIFWSLCVISKPPIWKAILAALIAPGWSGTWLNIRSIGRVTERGLALCRKWAGGLDSFIKVTLRVNHLIFVLVTVCGN